MGWECPLYYKGVKKFQVLRLRAMFEELRPNETSFINRIRTLRSNNWMFCYRHFDARISFSQGNGFIEMSLSSTENKVKSLIHMALHLTNVHWCMCIGSLTILKVRFTRGDNRSVIHNFYARTVDWARPFDLRLMRPKSPVKDLSQTNRRGEGLNQHPSHRCQSTGTKTLMWYCCLELVLG